MLDNDDDESKEQVILNIIMAINLLLAFAVYIRYDLYLDWYRSRKLLAEVDTL